MTTREHAERMLAKRLKRARASIDRNLRCGQSITELWIAKMALENRIETMADKGFVTKDGYIAWAWI